MNAEKLQAKFPAIHIVAEADLPGLAAKLDHVVICIPASQEREGILVESVRSTCKVMHLGGGAVSTDHWREQKFFVHLDDLYTAEQAAGLVRNAKLKSAAVACAEIAKARADVGAEHGWNDLLVNS